MPCRDLCVTMPLLAEVAMLLLCGATWRRLRAIEVNGICEWALAIVALDALAQGWQLWNQPSGPAGLAWLIHGAVSYTMVYVLYRLGDLVHHSRLVGGGRCNMAVSQRSVTKQRGQGSDA